ncbi:MAG: hypothetical protein A2Z18_00555 [Armatimonadetes bacterium RBG_16_58_9]|nr:MAG: hypothetical protein A2Z18_00555 [Armatimonadetes bacterium RBG_16_58_9]
MRIDTGLPYIASLSNSFGADSFGGDFKPAPNGTSNTADTEGDYENMLFEGGGIMCEYLHEFVIAQNEFTENVGGTHGGAIAVHSCLESNKIENNLFVHNHCTGDVGQSLGGGAIVSRDSKLDIVNNTFVQNWVGTGTWPDNITLAYCGGAVHAWLCYLYYEESAPQFRLINNIFYDNRAAEDGEGVVRGRSVASTHKAVANISYCDAYPGNQGDNYYPDPYDDTNNYNWGDVIRYLAPGFYDLDAGKYWLSSSSSLRESPNHGQNHSANAAVPKRI